MCLMYYYYIYFIGQFYIFIDEYHMISRINYEETYQVLLKDMHTCLHLHLQLNG